MAKHVGAKRVLIIQPTIAHYRVPFFNAVERLRPDWWTFAVTFDRAELKTPRLLQNPIPAEQLKFPTEDVRHVRLLGPLTYQTIWCRAARFDLIIAEHAVRDIAYLTCLVHRLHGVRFAWWGHGRDRSVEAPRGMKALAEYVKSAATKVADGYFAYTEGVLQELVSSGLSDDRIFALNNTIDISEHRRASETVRHQRDEIRAQLGVADDQVLLFVGRFTENKRIPFLLDAFSKLREHNRGVTLFLVGGGGERLRLDERPGVRWFGSIEDIDRLAPIYAASDLFVYPGAVGLSPLQALCHDLPVVAIDSPFHLPEVEYLTSANSVMLPRWTDSERFARVVDDLLSDEDRLDALQKGTWPSIRHLTIDAMAQNFIRGIDVILAHR
jgi:glycosyltransferase involved in cell wall biosynthesis